MSYNKEEFPQFAKAAGKISILAALAGVCVFMFALMVDVGQQEFQRVSAQSNTATTSLTVLNTPPEFQQGAFEVTESSEANPTNSGSVIQWSAIGNDSNGAPYFLLICSTNATPTANNAPDSANLGTAPPDCGTGAVQWGVSTGTINQTPAFVSTTTVEIADNAATEFEEENDWFAWVCDDDPVQPACNTTPVQGLNATNSSPFNMNQRPVLTAFNNNGGVDPGAILTFLSSSTDPDVVSAEDTLTLIVCQDALAYDSIANTCTTGLLATTTVGVTEDASALYELVQTVRDGSYPAVAFLIDNHGHEASGSLAQSFVVNNVAPTISGGDIDLNGGFDISLAMPGGQTTGFTLDVIVSDANSCINTSGATSSEMRIPEVAVFRSGVSASCNPSLAQYNPNNCYTNGVASTTWNLTCTASTTSCTGITDQTQIFNCTFPLWFVADPTDLGATPATDSPFASENWVARVAGVDDQFATGTAATNTAQLVDLEQAPAIELQTAEIPYGSLAPGNTFGFLGGPGATTTTEIFNIGNTGLDQEVRGESMCPDFAIGALCASSPSSTIPESQQRFSSTTVDYASAFASILSSSTIGVEVELDVNKTTATSSPEIGTTFWGIEVPASITVAGSYEGLNTFSGATAETGDW
jgi:hypothetical protein